MILNPKIALPMAAALVIALGTADVHAAQITDYRTYRAATATTLAGQGTNDPVVGDFANTADASFVVGYLDTPAVLGPDAGDFVKLSFSVSFTDSTTIGNAGDNFRFALFDLNGEAQDPSPGSPNYATAGTDNTDNFRGYFVGVRNGVGTGAGGSIRERIAMLVSGDNAFAATGANGVTTTSLGSPGGTSVTLASDGTLYDGVLTLTRNGSGLVDVSGSFIGSNNALGNTFSVSDLTPNTSSSYGAVGFLIGDALNVEQVNFRDVVVNIPEPASWALVLASLIGGTFVRRRFR